jgi:hypothetical protein
LIGGPITRPQPDNEAERSVFDRFYGCFFWPETWTGLAGIPGMQDMVPTELGPYCTKPVAVVGECGAEIGR